MAPFPLSDNDRGQDLARQGKMQEALDYYEEALKASPDNHVVLNKKAIVLISLDKFEESLIYSQRALSINPEAFEAWINAGVALDKLGRHHEASEALEHAVALNPYHAYARALLGMIYQKMDMVDRAELQNRKLQEIVFPKEYAGFYFTLAAFLLGTLLGGIRGVEGKSFEVSFGSQLIIFFFFCTICWLYWRSRRIWQETGRHGMVPYSLPAKDDMPSSGMNLIIILMIIVFTCGILVGGNVRSFL
jgi:tetratricopeptide (TPR) repeat protein